MDAMQEMLYNELRQIEQEVVESLQKKNRDNKVTVILNEELDDLRSALRKIEQGNYGLCELSGELIPGVLLTLVPTLKTVNDINHLESYRRKPLHFYS